MMITLTFRALPLYPDALRMYRKGETTGSNKPNRKLAEGSLEIATPLANEEEEILFDPQTSGGLLLSLPEEQADLLVNELRKKGVVHAVRIGEVRKAEKAGIRVV